VACLCQKVETEVKVGMIILWKIGRILYYLPVQVDGEEYCYEIATSGA